MSTNIRWVHPDITLQPPPAQGPGEEEEEEAAGGVDAPAAALPPPPPPNNNNQQPDRPGSSRPFPFENLPWEIQGKILQQVLYKEGQLVHCISRLDPFEAPASFPDDTELGARRSGLPKRFFFGRGACSIARGGGDPGEELGVLAASRRMHFLGVHIFYGLNTFAFSSLGELGRFCQGSGAARVARVQHVELLLTGSQYLTAPPDERGRAPLSRRTYPLTWLAEMPRLRTLVVHINETGGRYVRRAYENAGVKSFMAAKTAGQPNQRLSRSLRCVQGIDYIYSLRGLDFVRFYDFNQALASRSGARVRVQDWSFVEDVTNTCTLPKVPRRREHSELEKLVPLLPGGAGWRPGDDDWALVRSVYLDGNGRCSYDDMRLQGQKHDADQGSYLSAASSENERRSESRRESDDSSGSDSDSDDSGPSEGPRSQRSGSSQGRQRSRSESGSGSALFVSSDANVHVDSSLSLDESDDGPHSDTDTDADADVDTSADTDASKQSDPDTDSSSDESMHSGSGTSFKARVRAIRAQSQSQPGRPSAPNAQDGPRREATAATAITTTTSGGSDGNMFVTPAPPAAIPRRESTATSDGMFVTPAPGQIKREGTGRADSPAGRSRGRPSGVRSIVPEGDSSSDSDSETGSGSGSDSDPLDSGSDELGSGGDESDPLATTSSSSGGGGSGSSDSGSRSGGSRSAGTVVSSPFGPSRSQSLGTGRGNPRKRALSLLSTVWLWQRKRPRVRL